MNLILNSKSCRMSLIGGRCRDLLVQLRDDFVIIFFLSIPLTIHFVEHCIHCPHSVSHSILKLRSSSVLNSCSAIVDIIQGVIMALLDELDASSDILAHLEVIIFLVERRHHFVVAVVVDVKRSLASHSRMEAYLFLGSRSSHLGLEISLTWFV